MSAPVSRDERGRVLPGGGSLNPGGRPRVPELLRDTGPEMIAILLAIARGEQDDDRVSPGQAALALYDRAYPKPAPPKDDEDSEKQTAALDRLTEALASKKTKTKEKQ